MRAAFERITAGNGGEVHDFRVALRRLRSWLRAFRPELSDTVRKKTRRRLGAIADATSAARDAEVALAWIVAIDSLTAREQAGARYIADRLRIDRDAAQTAARAMLEESLPDVLDTLGKQLGTYWLRQDVEVTERSKDMASVTRDVLVRHADRFGQAVRRAKSIRDVALLHRARIAAKRLRYLAETLVANASASALVVTLAELQDTLGVVHDGSRVVERLVQEVADCAAHDARRTALASLHRRDAADTAPSFASVRPGLIALAKRAHAGERAAFDTFRRRWRRAQIADTTAAVATLAESLSG